MPKHVTRPVTTTLAATLAATVLATVTLSTASSAQAAQASFADKAGDISQGADLQRARVTNGIENLTVTVQARDLVRAPASGAAGAMFVDTDGTPGPEYVLTGGFFDGTDYAFLSTDSWDLRKATKRVPCSYSMRLDYAADTATFRIANDCFASAPGDGDVRVEVRTSGAASPGTVAVDWLGNPRTFGPAVPRS